MVELELVVVELVVVVTAAAVVSFTGEIAYGAPSVTL